MQTLGKHGHHAVAHHAEHGHKHPGKAAHKGIMQNTHTHKEMHKEMHHEQGMAMKGKGGNLSSMTHATPHSHAVHHSHGGTSRMMKGAYGHAKMTRGK